MLFESARAEAGSPGPVRPPAADPGFAFEIGFLLNFAAGKSTRFDFEPLFIFQNNGKKEYRRMSLQSEKALALLHSLDDEFFHKLLQFSDRRILEWMTRTGNRFIRSQNGSWAHASGRELANLRRYYRQCLMDIWPRIAENDKVFIHRNGRFNNYQPEKAALRTEKISFSFRVSRERQMLTLSLKSLINDQPVDFTIFGGILLESGGELFLPESDEVLAVVDLFKNGPLAFPMTVKKEEVVKYLSPWIAKYPVAIDPGLGISIIGPDPEPEIHLSELNESNLMIRPHFSYDGVIAEYGDDATHVEETGDDIIIVRRHKDRERRLYEWIRTLHPAFAAQRNNQYYYLPFADVMKRGWLITVLRRFRDEGYRVTGFEHLRKFRYSPHSPQLTVTARSSEEHFVVHVEVSWGEQSIPLADLRHAILKSQDTIMLDDGSLGHIPEEWLQHYSLLFRTAGEADGQLLVSKHHFMLLDEILARTGDNTVRAEIDSRKQKLLSFDSAAQADLPRAIEATLRPYQLTGYRWLTAMAELGWGACLADDMGLGKTLQTICFIEHLRNRHPGGTQLVVCPTSLIFNWESEVAKFCPTLKLHTHYGVQRELTAAQFSAADLVVTTYRTIRNDIGYFSDFLWQCIILDESQAIKNPDAQTTKAIMQLRAVHRVTLSGTPVQNNTFDLYSQFNFLNPGLLGGREFFDRQFARPIDRDGSREKTEQLRKLIQPFTLRRTKGQVATDLPDKIVSVLWCTMDGLQRNIYEQFRDGYRQALLKKIDEQGIAKSGMDVLEALLRLRQICDHPFLVTADEEHREASVKVQELLRDIQENMGDHKFLVFSQFTSMLALIREEFHRRGVSHCYLDGSTPLAQRQEAVKDFQEDPSKKAFLISLKAGGVGLNLTVADYVYLVDPWWNPAAEDQAIDRAHRIGQARNVFAYKMICKGTVEERIVRLQEKKKKLAEDLIQHDAGFVGNLTRDDIEFLFGT